MEMKNKKTKIRLEAVFQIALLIISIFAFAFIIGIGNVEIVSAQDAQPTSQAEEFIGCCFDTDQGTCDPNSLKSMCEEKENGYFLDDPLCDINECITGCCKIGLETKPGITQARCNKLSELYATPSSWDASIQDASQCIGSGGGQKIGACVFSEMFEDQNQCKFATKPECEGIGGGIFYENYLCSNEELNTICEKQATTACDDDRVYWFDSCGNRENIYSSNEGRSDNDGKVLSRTQSCNPNSANIDSTRCGNCNYELGSICKEDDGEPTCIDLNCEDAPDHAGGKKDRLNGESWCVYDGQVGNVDLGLGKLLGFNIPIGELSADPVGSRHWRYYCSNGEVEVEECADQRREICVQREKEVEGAGKVDEAICRTNLWDQCLGYNGDGGCKAACLAQCLVNNPDCRVHHVFSGEDFDMCVPKYPPGFDLETTGGVGGMFQTAVSSYGGELGDTINSLPGGGSGIQGADICSIGSRTCTMVFKKLCPGGWVCKENCDCQNIGFTVEMNNLCASLGDCGVYTNYKGVTPIRTGTTIKKKGSHGRTPQQPWMLAPFYFLLAKAVKGQFISSEIFDEVPEIRELPLHGLLDTFMGGYRAPDTPTPWGGEGIGGGSLGNQLVAGSVAAAGATIVASVTATSAGSMAISVGGLSIGFSPIGIVIVIVAVILTTVIGCGEVEVVEIEFTCAPWQPPVNGDCEVCNEDGLKICSKYRCSSLGLNCMIVNEGTGYDECINKDEQFSLPMIRPWEDALNKTLYTYTEVSNNGFRIRQADGECIQAFTPLMFGVQTFGDEDKGLYSSCRISADKTFGEIDADGEYVDSGFSGYGYFLENLDGRFTMNHTYATYLPSVDSLIYGEIGDGTGDDPDEWQEAYDELNTYLLDETGDLNLYVKCMNLEGNENDHDYMINFCIKPGPDLTPPVIGATAPSENNFTRFDATEQNMSLWVMNEPAECRWDVVEPTSVDLLEQYNGLSNEMTCKVDIGIGEFLTFENMAFFGYKCNTTLPITDVENKFYFLCRDQPWLGEDEARNIGADGITGGVYEYILKRSESALEITSILPEDGSIITRGTEVVTVDLGVVTGGGAGDGVAWCKYDLDDFGQVGFAQSNSNEHLSPGLTLTNGEHKIKINCRDFAGNTAEAETTFTLELDTVIPIVTRVYYESGSLVVITNEEAECSYTNDDEIGCIFNFGGENIMPMDGSLSKYLSAEWDSSLVYYIKCKDKWGNQKSGCSIIIQPEELG